MLNTLFDDRCVPGMVEMNPTGLPQRFQPCRPSTSLEKLQLLDAKQKRLLYWSEHFPSECVFYFDALTCCLRLLCFYCLSVLSFVYVIGYVMCLLSVCRHCLCLVCVLFVPYPSWLCNMFLVIMHTVSLSPWRALDETEVLTTIHISTYCCSFSIPGVWRSPTGIVCCV